MHGCLKFFEFERKHTVSKDVTSFVVKYKGRKPTSWDLDRTAFDLCVSSIWAYTSRRFVLKGVVVSNIIRIPTDNV
jgi:hypothetical protein